MTSVSFRRSVGSVALVAGLSVSATGCQGGVQGLLDSLLGGTAGDTPTLPTEPATTETTAPAETTVPVEEVPAEPAPTETTAPVVEAPAEPAPTETTAPPTTQPPQGQTTPEPDTGSGGS